MPKTEQHMSGAELQQLPDAGGHFGPYGGRFVAETLMGPLEELRQAYERYKDDPQFIAEFEYDLKQFVGRPSPLYLAERWSAKLGGAKVYLKREDLNHTGAHKVNNPIGQALLAKRMGKSRIIAETGAGQHGVATATVAAMFKMHCDIYMGREDIARQAPNVFRMKLLGANVVPVDSGTSTLKDAVNEALRVWVASCEDTYYIFGTAAGPHPFPLMVRQFHAVIGQEARAQCLEKTGRLPDVAVAFFVFLALLLFMHAAREARSPTPRTRRYRSTRARGAATVRSRAAFPRGRRAARIRR